ALCRSSRRGVEHMGRQAPAIGFRRFCHWLPPIPVQFNVFKSIVRQLKAMHKPRSSGVRQKALSKIFGGMRQHSFQYLRCNHWAGVAMRYDRDMRGYGANPPDPKWPGGAHVAVQFVVNYEEGGENCVLHGDKASEAFLSEIVGAAPWVGQRHWNMESIYEYGARAGFWRLHRILTEADVPATCYGVASALARSPDQVTAMQ